MSIAVTTDDQEQAMTVAFTAATTIGDPAGQVWDRLVDWDSAAQWMPGVDALRAEVPRPLARPWSSRLVAKSVAAASWLPNRDGASH
jgi:uncharacterized protein YndB with AHSA1/START domain